MTRTQQVVFYFEEKILVFEFEKTFFTPLIFPLFLSTALSQVACPALVGSKTAISIGFLSTNDCTPINISLLLADDPHSAFSPSSDIFRPRYCVFPPGRCAFVFHKLLCWSFPSLG